MTEDLNPKKPSTKIIDSLWTFSIATITIGPFALPLLWRNPRFSIKTKIIASILVIILTGFLLWFSGYVVTETVNRMAEFQ